MKDETLKKANELREEIRILTKFIDNAKSCWSRLFFRPKSIFHKGYGCYATGEYELTKELSKKILETMKEHLRELEEQYKNM